MRLEKIELFNYGIFKGTHSITFPPRYENNRTITLIGGLNGCGKTTLLEAIFLTLYGRRSLKFLRDGNTSYSDYLLNHINKSAPEKKASITLSIIQNETENDRIIIQRSWSNTKSDISDTLNAYKNETKDTYLSENWDYYIEEILPLNISRFFFFDNEKIAQLADDDSFQSVKDSIKALLGLTIIDNLEKDIKKLIKQISTANQVSSESNLYKRILQIQGDIDQCEADIAKSVTIIGKLNREIGQARKQYTDLENEFWDLGGDLRLKKDELEAEKQQAKALLSVKMTEVEEFVRYSHTPLLLCKSLLERTYNQVYLDSQAQSAMYSNKVIDRLTDILPKSIPEEKTQKAILEFLQIARKELIPNERYNILTELTPIAQNLFTAIVSESPQLHMAINKLINSIQEINKNLFELDSRLSFQIDSDYIKQIWEKLHILTQNITKLETKLKYEEEKQKSLLKHQQMLKKRLNDCTRIGKIEEQKQEESIRKLKYAHMTIEVMNAFKIRLQQKRVKELEKQIHECFTFMAQKESIIKRIEINPETLDIKLIDYNGGELLKSQLSAGEKQIFAVSILWGLAKCSGYQMPVIIDTPLGRLDSNHRTNFVKRYLPYASKQVIILSTDEEINGEYFKLIEPYVNGIFLLHYNEQESSTSIQAGYFGGHKA